MHFVPISTLMDFEGVGVKERGREGVREDVRKEWKFASSCYEASVSH